MLKHKGTQKIRTSRLLLRKISVEDYRDMYRYASKEEVAKYVSWTVHQSPDDTKALCQMWVEQYKSDDKYHWAIVFNNRVIGNIEIGKIVDKTAFVGWQIDSEFWNQGIMTEAAAAVRDYMFNEVGIDRLNAGYILENIGSGRVMQKIGMKAVSSNTYYEKIEDKSQHKLDIDGKPVGFYSISREEWKCLHTK